MFTSQDVARSHGAVLLTTSENPKENWEPLGRSRITFKTSPSKTNSGRRLLKTKQSSPYNNFGSPFHDKKPRYKQDPPERSAAGQAVIQSKTRQQEHMYPKETEWDRESSSRRSDWKYYMTTLEPPPKTSETPKKRTLKNGEDSSSECPGQTRMRSQHKQISKLSRYPFF